MDDEKTSNIEKKCAFAIPFLLFDYDFSELLVIVSYPLLQMFVSSQILYIAIIILKEMALGDGDFGR